MQGTTVIWAPVANLERNWNIFKMMIVWPADGVSGDGGDSGLVWLGVGHSEVVNTLEVVDLTKLNPDLQSVDERFRDARFTIPWNVRLLHYLISHGVAKLIQHRLNHRIILEVERRLEWTWIETQSNQWPKQQVDKNCSEEEPSYWWWSYLKPWMSFHILRLSSWVNVMKAPWCAPASLTC